MAVTLDFLQPGTFARELAEGEYLYKDLFLDLQLDYPTLPELLASSDYEDLRAIYDANSVFQSLYNIFSTSPGQKFLNPEFGLDLKGFVFSPVNERLGYLLGLKIQQLLPIMEPRIAIDKIDVFVFTDDLTYEVNIYFRIPSLDRVPPQTFNMKAKFNSNGFTIIS